MRYSRNQINKAGELLISSKSQADFDNATKIVNEWRELHMPVLEDLNNKLLELFSAAAIKFLFHSKRLKRMTSILSKLDNNPTMKLGGLQDIGGLRFVFGTIDELLFVYDYLQHNIPMGYSICKTSDYVTVDGELKGPKESGYRSIHIAYKYCSDNKDLDSIRVELQIRTKLQHLWATALETAGIVSKTSLKAGYGDIYWVTYFKLVSCLFAIKEKQPIINTLTQHSLNKIMKVFSELDLNKNLTSTLKALRVTQENIAKANYSHNFYLIKINYLNKVVSVLGYTNEEREEAAQEYASIEKECVDGQVAVVLVSVDKLKDLKDAYPSYFLDCQEFVNIMDAININAQRIQLNDSDEEIKQVLGI